MLVTQVALLVSISVMGFIKPDLSIWTVAYLAAAVAFFSASQDVVLDAYRRELLPDVELGLRLMQFMYRRIDWPAGAGLACVNPVRSSALAYGFYRGRAFMFVGIILTLVIDEAISEPDRRPKTMAEAIVEPFREFIGRKGVQSAALILLFLFLYKLGDSMATALQTPFFIDMGFSRTEIGSVAKLAALVASIFGGLFGWHRHDQARNKPSPVDFRRHPGRKYSWGSPCSRS